MLCNWFIACESITKLCRKFDDMEDLRWKNMAPWMTSLWSTTSCSKWLNFLFVEGTCLQSKASPQSTKPFRNWQINVFSPTVLYWSVLRARHLSWANLNEGDSAHIVIYILKWLLLPPTLSSHSLLIQHRNSKSKSKKKKSPHLIALLNQFKTFQFNVLARFWACSIYTFGSVKYGVPPVDVRIPCAQIKTGTTRRNPK